MSIYLGTKLIQLGNNGRENPSPLNVRKNGTYTDTNGYSPVTVDVPQIANINYGSHVNSDGKWIKPDDWDDIESIDLTNKHECYFLCGTKLNNYPFVRLRVYGSGTIKCSYGHVSNGIYTKHADSTETTVSSGGYFGLYLGNITDEYIVIRITATTYLAHITPSPWTADTNIPGGMPGSGNAILMRYGRLTGATTLSLSSCIYVESDKIIDFAKRFENTTQAITLYNNYINCYNLQKVNIIGTDFSKLNITTISSLFSGCYSLSELSTEEDGNVFDLTGAIKSTCTNIGSMFSGCYSLKTKLIVKNWDVSNVTSMASMCNNCKCLELVEGTETWTRANKCTAANSMFYYCQSLRGTIDLSSLYLGHGTANLTSIASMFAYCLSLDKIILNNIDLSQVTTMTGSFQYCSAKEIIFNENFIPPSNKCTTFANMFSYSGIKELVIDGWDFNGSTTTGLASLFGALYSAEKIEIKNINFTRTSTWADGTSSSTAIIRYNYNLKSIDMSWFDMSICTGTAAHLYGFTDCPQLIDFYPPKNISKKFSVSNNTQLSVDSLVRIIDNLKTVTTTTQLALGSYNLAKLTDEQKAVATGKGWTLA